MNELMRLSARELAARIRRKEVSPVEATQAALDQIATRQDLNAFITVTADLALAQAREAEQRLLRGGALPPLLGLPYSAKDLILTAGVRTTMGSAIYEHFVPTQDALAVARVNAAGAVLIGKTTTPEFGHKQGADAPLFGRTLNPIHLRCFQQRRRRGRRGRHGAAGAGHRRRRLHPHPCLLLRHRRAQAHAGPGCQSAAFRPVHGQFLGRPDGA